MIADDDGPEAEIHARKLQGAMLDHGGLPVGRLPGLAAALEGFVAQAPKCLLPLVNRALVPGTVEPLHSTTLFQAIDACAGLVAAVFAIEEPPARMLVALDEKIDELIVNSIFGESAALGEDSGKETPPRSRTPIETALLEEFARCLGRAIEAGFAPVAPIALAFERLAILTDTLALGRRDAPAAAARFSLPMAGGVCEGLILLPQGMLLPFRKELERDPAGEAAYADRRWSTSMETGVKQTRLPVTAILEEIPMSLGDIATLRVGVVLPLQSPDFASVRLECAGRGMFQCRLGQGDGRYRLEIESPVAQPLEPSPF
jgi:flagellar motor switch protein FliM